MLRLLLPFVLLVGALFLTTLADRPAPKADFTFINKNDVTTLDIQRMSWMQDLRVARLVYEGLVRNDIFTWDYAIRPGMAERWEVSPDNRVYTFFIRPGAQWSNGAPVTAQDFVFSWRRAMLPDTGGDYTRQFQLIKGGHDFVEWRRAELERFAGDRSISDRAAAAKEVWDRTIERFDQDVALRAVDDRTLRVELENPTPYFLELCAFAVFCPVYPPLVERYERLNPDTGMMETEQGWTKPPTIVSNGPFLLTDWRFKREMRLSKNPRYWDRAGVAIDTISIPAIEDPNAAVLAFRTGAVDWISDVVAGYTPEMLAQKRAYYDEHRVEYEALAAQGLDPVEIDRRLPPDPRQGVHAYPAFGTYFLNFNCSPKLPDGRDNPFRDPRVRRAFTMVIDRRTVATDIRRLGEPVTETLIPTGTITGYSSPRGVRCVSDAKSPEEAAGIVAEARRLLAEAGYPDPSAFITVDILFTKDGGHDEICQIVAKNWEESLGVQVTLTQKEIKGFRDDARRHNFIVSRGSWYGDYGDPTTFLDINRTGDGNNDRNYSNPEYDRLLDEAGREADATQRMELLRRAEELLLQDAPLLPIFRYAAIYAFDPHKITGISSHPRTDQNLFLVDVFGDHKGTDTPRTLPSRPGREY